MAEKANETSPPAVAKYIHLTFILHIRIFFKIVQNRGFKVFN